MTETARRPHLSGAIYQRSSDGRWCAAISYPQSRDAKRKRRVIYGSSRAEVEQRLAEALANEPEVTTRPRRELLIEARDLGRHTPQEWEDVLSASRGVCFYCRVPVGRAALQQDHRVPLTRGGSDSVENLAPTCGPCNAKKRTMTDVEYVAYLTLGAE